jgi:hypothetical protein
VCNACGFLCCGSDEFEGCGCYHCGEPACLRICKHCGENECDGYCQSDDDDGYYDAAYGWSEPEFKE